MMIVCCSNLYPQRSPSIQMRRWKNRILERNTCLWSKTSKTAKRLFDVWKQCMTIFPHRRKKHQKSRAQKLLRNNPEPSAHSLYLDVAKFQTKPIHTLSIAQTDSAELCSIQMFGAVWSNKMLISFNTLSNIDFSGGKSLFLQLSNPLFNLANDFSKAFIAFSCRIRKSPVIVK